MSVVRKILPAVFICCFISSLFALEGKIIECTGKVEVQKGSSWVAVNKNDVLKAGDVISTGFKSEAVIAFDETKIKVKALTRLSIEQLFEQNGDKASTVYLDTGSISADVKPAENKRVGFTVKSPAATASVRGTMGEVYADGTVIGIEGKWCITPPEPKLVFAQEAAGDEGEDSAGSDEAGIDADDTTAAAIPEEATVSEEVAEAADGSEAGVSGNVAEAGQPVDGTVAETAAEPVEAAIPEADMTAEPAPVVPETPVMEASPVFVAEEPAVPEVSFNFDYPNDMGAVFVNPGETAVFTTTSVQAPMDYYFKAASGSNGTQLLSSTERNEPASIVPAAAPVSSGEVTVTVPERPKYGTVEVRIILP